MELSTAARLAVSATSVAESFWGNTNGKFHWGVVAHDHAGRAADAAGADVAALHVQRLDDPGRTAAHIDALEHGLGAVARFAVGAGDQQQAVAVDEQLPSPALGHRHRTGGAAWPFVAARPATRLEVNNETILAPLWFPGRSPRGLAGASSPLAGRAIRGRGLPGSGLRGLSRRNRQACGVAPQLKRHHRRNLSHSSRTPVVLAPAARAGAARRARAGRGRRCHLWCAGGPWPPSRAGSPQLLSATGPDSSYAAQQPSCCCRSCCYADRALIGPFRAGSRHGSPSQGSRAYPGPARASV